MPRATCHSVSETALLFTAPPWTGNNESLLDAQTILDPLLGRSLLQRSVEHLVRLGAQHLMVVLGDNASEIREFIKAGERWGCRISYHYPDPRAPMRQFLKAIGIVALEHYRVGNAWSIIPPAIKADSTRHGAGSTLHWQDGDAARWTGWGCLSGAWLLSRNIPADPVSLGASIAEDEWLERNLVVPTLTADTPGNLIAGVKHLLNEIDTTMYKAAQAQIHPTARLIAPCYIGKAVNIDAGAVIGPHAVIEDGAFVAARAQIRRSVILPESYVGEDLELDHAIVRGPTLINAALISRTEITDPELLSHLHSAPVTSRWSIRAIAAILHVALSPFYLLLRRSRRLPAEPADHVVIPCPRQYGHSMASMRVALALPPHPDPEQPYDWGLHFVTTLYPGLVAVRRGKLRLCGPTLRSWHEATSLPEHWRRIYQECSCGLLNDSLLQVTPTTGSDEAFASDALAAASPETPQSIFKHLFPYLNRVWHDYRKRGASPTPVPRQLNTV